MTIATDVESIILQSDASGALYRLEYVRGRLKIEASPASRHQMTIDRIRESLKPTSDTTNGCGCYSLADTLIRFPDPDQSLKRPDIAIFCNKPPESDEALDVFPEAVIEILSLGYEDKDLGEDGAPFYIACGVRDVVVVDPRSDLVRHYRADGVRDLTRDPAPDTRAPIPITLQCGCEVHV